MRSGTKGLLRALSVAAVLAVVVGFAFWRLDTAEGDGTVVKVVAPPSAPGGQFEVRVEIENAPPPEPGCPDPTGGKMCGLASYEWVLKYNPTVLHVEGVTDGGFLSSTGRGTPTCLGPLVGPAPGLEAGKVKFSCATTGAAISGPSGSGILSKLTFSGAGGAAVNMQIVCAELSDAFAEDIPISNVPGCAAPLTTTPTATATPGGPPAPTATPQPGNTPAPTNTPGGPTPTRTLGPGETPGPTNTPRPGETPVPTATPTGPTPTPTPVPPGWQAVPLVKGCQFLAWTGEDGTTPGELAALVGPSGNLTALWAQQPAPVWKGYSPRAPAEANDMEPSDFLDVVAICAAGPGALGRPIV